MRTLLILLLSFNSFAQDSIPCPCDLNRQQTRLFFSAYEKKIKLEETRLKLEDDQHERENTKEIKSLRIGYRSLKVENVTIRKQFKLTEDSLKRFYALEIQKEKNRSKESLKTLRNELTNERNARKLEQIEARKKPSWNVVWIVIGIALILILLLLVRFNRK